MLFRSGAPPELVRPTSEPVAWDPLLADPRMAATATSPSCLSDSMGSAYPPRRLVQTAQSLEASGALSTVASICDLSVLDLAGFVRR